MSRKNSRWPDEEDFTSEHDEMMIHLMRNYKELLTPLLKTENKVDYSFSDLDAEPCLSGYPPLYPDALVRVHYRYNHQRFGKPPIQEFDIYFCEETLKSGNGLGRPRIDLICPVCGKHHIILENGPLDGCGYDASRFVPIRNHEYVWSDKVLTRIEDFLRKYAGSSITSDCKEEESKIFVIEIKPRIDSLGSVLRQVKLYRSRIADSICVLLTKDARFDELFKSQRIEVVHYQSQSTPKTKNGLDVYQNDEVPL